MECDLEILGSKLKQISQAILTKECMLEEVLLDIQSCRYDWDETWEVLRKACGQLRCSKLKGRVASIGDTVFLEVPILSDLASLIAEVMSGALGVLHEKQKETNKDSYPERIAMSSKQYLALPEANRSFIGQVIEVSLGHIMLEAAVWSIDVSLVKIPAGFHPPTSTKVVLARLV
jgi:hypothetical protein